jgi:serine/threonine-protein kinase HipA
MIRVWSDQETAGTLDRQTKRNQLDQQRGSTFVYEPRTESARAVSVTMPVRTASWNTNFGLAPIFEMNLPEGALREHLRLRFAKAVGTFDDFDLLGVVGRTQIGRIRYSAIDSELTEDVPFQAIDEILRARRGNKLFDYLMETFAVHSGLSGVQPKVMIRGKEVQAEPPERYLVRGASHIVKLWHEDEYPDLAANEFFCLSAAKASGLQVPSYELSDGGAALVIERFDLVQGQYAGFEDFCVLNALGTDKKYSGGYERRLFKRLRDFIAPEQWPTAAEKLFRLFVLNCAIRNGDAHLKNFGITYSSVNGDIELAPVYDLVTTTPYSPRDSMALTLSGSTNWPTRKTLEELGQARADLSLQKIGQIIEQTADAMSDVAPKMKRHFKGSEYAVGARMEEAWLAGIRDTLGFGERSLTPVARPKPAPRLTPSDARILEFLRENRGSLGGTKKVMSAAVGIAESTFSAATKRLSDRGLISKQRGRIDLVAREV